VILIELSGPPRGKGRGRAVAIPGRGARVYSDPATVKYETQLRYAATQAMAGRTPIEGPVRIVMEVRFPVPESWSKKKKIAALAGDVRPTVKPDADNSLKLCDALNQIVFKDDAQVVEAAVRKHYSALPGMRIEIRAIGATDAPRPAAPRQSAESSAGPLFSLDERAPLA
jgi:Holliday junction resolvase RusA-like endonuclease